MNLDITIRALFLAIEMMPKPKSFLLDLLFTDREMSDVEEITIEYKRGNRFIAPFVNRYIDGQTMPKESFTGKTFKPYKIAPKHNFTANELYFERMAGENPYMKTDPETKRNKKIADTLQEQEEQIQRRMEKMAAEVAYDLQVTIQGDGIKDEIHYYENNKNEHHTNATISWDNASADPVSDIKIILRTIAEAGGTKPNILVMDPLAADLFMSNAKVKELLNVRNYFVGEMRPEVEGISGASYIGRLSGIGVDIYEYQEYYETEDSNGTIKVEKIVPENTVLFATTGNKIKFAPEATIENGLMQGMFIPRIYEDTKFDTVELRTISKPVLIPQNTKSLKVLKVK